MRSRLLILIAAVVCSPAQEPRPSFDAASLKPSGNDPMVRGLRMKGGPGSPDPGRITYTQVALMQILAKAWDLPIYRIVGPDWLKEPDRNNIYTLTATLPPETTKAQFLLMLQDLLIQRFHMQWRLETRKFSGYDLVVAPGGPKLAQAADTSDPGAGPRGGADKQGFALLPPGHGAGLVLNNGMHAKFQAYTMTELADTYLMGFVMRATGEDAGPIRDKTGLTGQYDFTLVFDDTGAGVVAGPAARGAEQPASNLTGQPGIFVALEKQLGLKLVKVKDIPLDVLVIDRMDRTPVGN
jgi:uncharacterized protein (TIGR03435 family)